MDPNPPPHPPSAIQLVIPLLINWMTRWSERACCDRDFVHVVVACLLGKGSVEFIFVQFVLGTDHNCIATCQISANRRKTKAIRIRGTTRKKSVKIKSQFSALQMIEESTTTHVSPCHVYFNDPPKPSSSSSTSVDPPRVFAWDNKIASWAKAGACQEIYCTDGQESKISPTNDNYSS